MSNYKKTNSSSSTLAQKAEKGNTSSRFIDTQTSTTNTVSDTSLYAEVLTKCLTGMAELEKRTNTLEKKISFEDNPNDISKEYTKLAHTSRIAMILLMFVPVIQLFICSVIVHNLGLEEKLPNILRWFLGGISLFSFVEMILLPIKIYHDSNKYAEFEKRIEKIESHISNDFSKE